MKWYMLKDGEIKVTEDALIFESWRTGENDEWRIGLDAIGEAKVSTVFLGIDHAWGGGPPILFETMIFGGTYNQFQQRYATLEEAVAGHANVVSALKAGRDPNDV